jgi:hypothetical protein
MGNINGSWSHGIDFYSQCVLALNYPGERRLYIIDLIRNNVVFCLNQYKCINKNTFAPVSNAIYAIRVVQLTVLWLMFIQKI